MINYDNYRGMDTLVLSPVFAEVYEENELGELIDPINGYALSEHIYEKSEMMTHTQLEKLDVQRWIYDHLESKFYIDSFTDISICGATLHIWQREDKDGVVCKNGDYYVDYMFELYINGIRVGEDDLNELCPNFEW